MASVLEFQLDEAVDNEDFQEAAVLKEALAVVSAGDTVSEIMKELKNDTTLRQDFETELALDW